MSARPARPRALASTALVAGAALLSVAACQPRAGKPAPDLPRPPTTASTTHPASTPPPTTAAAAPPSLASPSTVTATATINHSSTAALSPGGLPAGQVPLPGQVGFRGDPAALKVVDGPASAPPGTQWNSGALRFAGGDVTLEGVHVKGGIEYSGTGTLTIRDSIIEGDHRSWSPIMGNSGHIDVRDTTITYRDAEWPGPQWGNGAIHGDATVTVIRCDISGTPDGIQNGPGKSRIEQNHIHDLLLAGTYPHNTHNDGIQNYGGPDLLIKHNRIDISKDGQAYDGSHQNAAVFIMPSDGHPSKNLRITGNHLSGGGYTLRLGIPMTNAVITDNEFGPTTGGWGVVLTDGGQITQWSNNTNADGKPIPRP